MLLEIKTFKHIDGAHPTKEELEKAKEYAKLHGCIYRIETNYDTYDIWAGTNIDELFD